MHACVQGHVQEVESIFYTIKEVNSVAGCVLYTTACICAINDLPAVKEISERIFINTEVLYWCDNTVKGTIIVR